ncbi:hypothetical protein G436_0725 [Leptospira interrogans serovar Hardjo str. Norma]|uniref:Uncharacterized protein n=1 Tax=Leptospira interrogans serovar Hardjo str. Norma TaxID=1279460 RepID=A0A0M4N364_LEPIR|nr:hypothetical protein G436_0725 [Leptospira interrogans serovar Hardjo str. Norma]
MQHCWTALSAPVNKLHERNVIRYFSYVTIELLKNSLVPINKTASIDRFHEIENRWRIDFSTTLII